jgi:hypothetical protein
MSPLCHGFTILQIKTLFSSSVRKRKKKLFFLFYFFAKFPSIAAGVVPESPAQADNGRQAHLVYANPLKLFAKALVLKRGRIIEMWEPFPQRIVICVFVDP